MRKFIIRLLWWLLDFRPIKAIFHPFAEQSTYHSTVLVERYLRAKYSDTIPSGPFKGLKYPQLRHHGEQILAGKFLGTFELELHPIFNVILNTEYATVHNIGSADGYYSVGIALKGKVQKVVAWEMLPHMRTTTERVAEANSVSNIVLVRGICEPELLKNETSDGRTLILSDCEGAEDVLLDPAILQQLVPYDILVECHDLFVPGVTERLKSRFSSTHKIEQVWTELRVLDQIPNQIREDLPFKEYLIASIIQEPRLYRMSWLWMTPRA